MFTPQQIEQVSFGRATFGGYDMQAVDEFLEPLLEDYITLYKENALLKSKMKVLVGKLEEYRSNEASMKDAIVNAQKTCDMMVKEAEAKCTQMLNDANAAAAENAKNADSLIAAENARVEEARKTSYVDAVFGEIATDNAELQDQIRACITALDRIKESNRPREVASNVFDYDRIEGPDAKTDAVADEISANLEALVGTAEEAAPKAEPKHPTSDTTTGKFVNLQFGRNYDPKNHK